MPNKQYGPMMFGQQKPTRVPATVARAKKHGAANQLEHEQDGRMQRDAMKKRIAREKAERLRSAAPKTAKDDRGMNAGTMGRSRV